MVLKKTRRVKMGVPGLLGTTTTPPSLDTNADLELGREEKHDPIRLGRSVRRNGVFFDCDPRAQGPRLLAGSALCKFSLKGRCQFGDEGKYRPDTHGGETT